MIIFYHYAYPQFNHPIREADWQKQVVGDIRQADLMMLDIEENTPHATPTWVHDWLRRQKFNYALKRPLVYASSSYVKAHLQDTNLAKYPLCLANWQFNPNENPPCPSPWIHYHYLQYTDRAHVPGIPGTVDADVFIK
jgi:GH25 family lysozyme M1 (1,4-beta-N-acetylmuramidase)